MTPRPEWAPVLVAAGLVGILAWIAIGSVETRPGFDPRTVPVPELSQLRELPEPDGTLLVYPDGTEPIEVAGQWTTHLLGIGLKKLEDHSRPGRTVSVFRDADGDSVILAVGATRTGAFAAIVEPEAPLEHWTLQPDASAPVTLHPLLPPPKAADSEPATTSIATPTGP